MDFRFFTRSEVHSTPTLLEHQCQSEVIWDGLKVKTYQKLFWINPKLKRNY